MPQNHKKINIFYISRSPQRQAYLTFEIFFMLEEGKLSWVKF